MQNMSPARLYALVFGVVLVVAGIIGFFYESEFTDDEAVRDAVFGILDVNGWHNVVHIATGALGLLAFAAGAYAARATPSAWEPSTSSLRSEVSSSETATRSSRSSRSTRRTTCFTW